MMLALLGLPFVAAAVLAMTPSRPMRVWIDLGAGLAILALALALAVTGPDGTPLLRQDRMGAFAAVLVAGAALAHPASPGKQLVLGGALLAGLAENLVVAEAGLELSVVATLAPRLAAGWHRVPLAGAGLGLLLFGAVTPPAALASACTAAGLAVLAYVAPALLPVLPLLAARVAGPPLVALGLAGLIGCGLAALLAPRRSPTPWIALGQLGVAALAFGLKSPESTCAGLVLTMLLTLAQAARDLSRGPGLTRLCAEAGLAGLPPFAVFPGLVLAVGAVAKQPPILLAALLAGLALLGWATVRRAQPTGWTESDRWSPAWIPLAIAVPVGWALPGVVTEWLRALALEVLR